MGTYLINGIDKFPNLETIEFPENIVGLKHNTINDCPKITIAGLRFQNNNCSLENGFIRNRNDPKLSERILQEIRRSCFSKLNDSQPSLEECIIAFNRSVFLMSKEEKRKYSAKMLELLKSKEYNIQTLMEKVTNNELLTCADILFFNQYVREELNLPANPFTIETENSRLVSIDPRTGRIDMGYYSLLQRQEGINGCNFMIMFALCHDLNHLRQWNNTNRIKNFESSSAGMQRDYIDHKLDDIMPTEIFPPYRYKHDEKPVEISAHMGACNFLVRFFDKTIQDSKVKKIFILKTYATRSEKMRNGYRIEKGGAVKRKDYRLSAIKELLEDKEILPEKREQLVQLQKQYLEFKRKCQKRGIDIYEIELELYGKMQNVFVRDLTKIMEGLTGASPKERDVHRKELHQYIANVGLYTVEAALEYYENIRPEEVNPLALTALKKYVRELTNEKEKSAITQKQIGKEVSMD